jgi:transaldolase
MKFFVDTADVAEIEDLAACGLLDGVTTNPSLIMKSSRPMHVLTDIGLKAFLDDWAKTGQSIL